MISATIARMKTVSIAGMGILALGAKITILTQGCAYQMEGVQKRRVKMGEIFDRHIDSAGNLHYSDTESGHHEIRADIIHPAKEPEAIPLEWIDKHLAWLDSCDNDFAQLAKVSIRAMVQLWRECNEQND